MLLQVAAAGRPSGSNTKANDLGANILTLSIT
jgi:hypothetical protein